MWCDERIRKSMVSLAASVYNEFWTVLHNNFQWYKKWHHLSSAMWKLNQKHELGKLAEIQCRSRIHSSHSHTAQHTAPTQRQNHHGGWQRWCWCWWSLPMFDVVSLVTTIPLPPILAFTDSIKTCSTRHSTHAQAQHCGPESKQNIYFYIY